MENWNNLNKVLTEERESTRKKLKESLSLIDACQNNDKNKVKILLKEGVAINCYDDFLTPLIVCVKNNNLELGKYLINSGASINFVPKKEMDNAFWVAAKESKYDFIRMFLLQKIEITRESQTNTTALIYGTEKSDVTLVEMLVNYKRINVNERDGNGNTALHYNAAKTPYTDDDGRIAKLLIAAGVDSKGKNIEGKTPYDMTSDYTAQSLLLAVDFDNKLPEKDEGKSDDFDIEKDKSHGVKRVSGKIKI